MRGKRLSIGLRTALVIFTVTLLVTSGWAATNWNEKVLHSFNNNGTDGYEPYFFGSLIFDAAGNLYGTTYAGGIYGYGTAFELSPAGGGSWTETVLYNFGNGTGDGRNPRAGLIFDAAGNLYGTTTTGGTSGDGTVFELTPTGGGGWTERVLYSFGNTPDGAIPVVGLIFDATGNLYGATTEGGTHGDGTVFELTPTGGGGWTERVLYSFGNTPDGAYANAVLIFDAAGNLYGTTELGGANGPYGTVFELTPTGGGGWTEKVLHSFANGTDGTRPLASVIFDAAGNLYGTTSEGGTNRDGTVFELMPAGGGSWTETLLHSFNNNGTDGFLPNAGLIFDAAGNLYSTTYYGGAGGGCQPNGCGTVFELTPSAGGGWTETVLHSFNSTDGAIPVAGLIFDATGNLYGTTTEGGTLNAGTVFELTPEVFPTSLDFGPQGLNPNTPQTVILTNVTDQPLSITSLMVTGTNNRDFLESDNCPRSPNTLAPGDHCTITVVFSPTDTGTLTAAVTITDNAPDSPQVVPLTGIGVGGKVRLK